MSEAEAIDSDEARRLLRLAKFSRYSFLPWFLVSRGLEASDELQSAARRGNLSVLQVLAEPAPQPSYLLSYVWRDLLESQRSAAGKLIRHVHREGGG